MAARAPLLDDGDAALFPKLTDVQVEMLSSLGEVRSIEAGEILFGPGDPTYDVMVLLEGSVSVVVGSGLEARELARQAPGDLMAELNLFTGQGTDATGIARERLTSYGMVAQARRTGEPPSSVVALWKDNARGRREIRLDTDAQGILLALERQPAIRRAADGRTPKHDAIDLRVSAVIQLRTASPEAQR